MRSKARYTYNFVPNAIIKLVVPHPVFTLIAQASEHLKPAIIIFYRGNFKFRVHTGCRVSRSAQAVLGWAGPNVNVCFDYVGNMFGRCSKCHYAVCRYNVIESDHRAMPCTRNCNTKHNHKHLRDEYWAFIPIPVWRAHLRDGSFRYYCH